MIKPWRGLGCGFVLGILGAGILSASVAAQSPVPPAPVAGQPGAASNASDQPASNPVCVRLEGQLAIVNRGGADPGRADQIKRYEDSVAKQQADLDRMLAQGKRRGCEGGGFFSLFTGQSQECQPINAQIQQMRDGLDRTMSDLERLKSGNNYDQDGQRRQLIGQLAQNNCGPQYRAAAAAAGPAGFLELAVRRPQHHQSGRRRRAIGHLPHRLRARLRRLLFPDFLFDCAEPVCRRRAHLSARVPGDRGRALYLPQSRRRHRPGGLAQRPVLHGFADRFSVPQRILADMLVPAAGSELGGRAQRRRRRLDARERRHRRHRPERQSVVATAGAERGEAHPSRARQRMPPPLAAPERRQPWRPTRRLLRLPLPTRRKPQCAASARPSSRRINFFLVASAGPRDRQRPDEAMHRHAPAAAPNA